MRQSPATGSLTRHAHRPVQTRPRVCCFSTQANNSIITGPTFMETFAGIGVFALAAAKHGLTCVYANESNSYCVNTYEQNHCKGGPGIKNVDDRPIEAVTHDMRRHNLPRATLLFGGFPCPSYSNNGKLEGLDSEEYGHYLYEVMKVVIRLQNPVVILENVSTFATNTVLEGIEVVRKEFDSAGYYMTWGIYKAVDFNLAQNRQRCFIVAVRKDLASAPFECKSISSTLSISIRASVQSDGGCMTSRGRSRR